MTGMTGISRRERRAPAQRRRRQAGLSREPRLIVTGLVLASGTAVLAAVAVDTADQPTVAVVWGGIALAAWCAGLLCLTSGPLYGGTGMAQWRTGPWLLAWCAVTSGLATVTFSQPQQNLAQQVELGSVLRALWLTAVAIGVWAIGYAVGPGRGARRVAARHMQALSARYAADVRSLATPWVLYAIGTAARAATAATTGHFGYVGDVSSSVSNVSGYGQVLADLALLAPAGVAAAALQVFREHRRGARLTLAVLGTAEFVAGALEGGKQDFIITALAVIIPLSAARFRLPKTVLVLAAAVFLVIVVPFNQAYRNAARSGPVTLSTSQAIGDAPAIAAQAAAPSTALGAVSGSVSYLLLRIRGIDNVAIIMQRTPSQIPYLPAAQLAEAPVANLIPRALWPGKPLLTAGYQFGQEYYGVSPAVLSTDAVTPVGDLWRHGGWPPLLAGMFLLGTAVRLLDITADIRANAHTVFLVLILLPSVVKAEDDWITLVASFPAAIAVWVLTVALTFRRAPRHRAAPLLQCLT
jgi:hypothetical protein